MQGKTVYIRPKECVPRLNLAWHSTWESNPHLHSPPRSLLSLPLLQRKTREREREMNLPARAPPLILLPLPMLMVQWQESNVSKTCIIDLLIRGFLLYYKLELHHLTSGDILHIAMFITLCEAYLEIESHFNL
jgi:hypothetical protein